MERRMTVSPEIASCICFIVRLFVGVIIGASVFVRAWLEIRQERDDMKEKLMWICSELQRIVEEGDDNDSEDETK